MLITVTKKTYMAYVYEIAQGTRPWRGEELGKGGTKRSSVIIMTGFCCLVALCVTWHCQGQ